MASNNNTVAKTYDLALPVAKELGLELWDVVFEKEGASWYLRVFIDKENGVEMDDCEAFTRIFNKILDDEDYIEQSYIFEVGSPGVGRLLRKPEHFEKYIGQEVRVHLIRATDGIKEVVGNLEKYSKECINVDGKEIKLSEVAFVRLNDDKDLFSE